MQTAGEFVLQGVVHEAMPVDARRPCEGVRSDSHAVVGLSAGRGAGVPGMARRIVDDLKGAWRENRAQPGFNT